jgi:hypothetical protein
MKQKKKDKKTIINKDQQILKCRDDKEPVILSRVAEQDDTAEPFRLADGYKCSWLKKDETLGPAKLRPRIEPWLTALFQSEHLSLLVGSGLSNAVHHIATIETKKSMLGMGAIEFNHFDKVIKAEAKRSAAAAGREEGNFEDQIRVANELLRGLEIIGTSETFEGNAVKLRIDLKRILDDFVASILKGETELITSKAEYRENAFKYLVSFLMSFANMLNIMWR